MLFVLITLLMLSSLAGSILWIARVQAHKLIHPKRRKVNCTPESVGILSWEDVSFNTADGLTLHGWFIPPSPFSEGETVIAVHGFSSNRLRFLEQAALLHQQGYGVLLFDLRNHGESEGNLTSLGLYEVRHEVALAGHNTVLSKNMFQSYQGVMLGFLETQLRGQAEFASKQLTWTNPLAEKKPVDSSLYPPRPSVSSSFY